ncbi:MAG: DUF47 family protein [Candidatus Cloacimonetes bacterium]|nr:DUF47 family protein [Candidatus Cloacimonadota bacterium]MBS3768475.1 DUF47 family protein [Candidatus Cloacimonadota bacterium]
MAKLFMNRTKQLEEEISAYLDQVSRSGLIFYEAIKSYILDDKDRFNEKFVTITKMESEADEKRRSIKHKLYTYMLIPESRGDVLGLLENMDGIVDCCEKTVERFSIECPEIPEFAQQQFLNLAKFSRKAVEEVVKASRSFFKEINLVEDFINKVHFYEHEADDVEEKLKRTVFQSDIKKFSRKVHLRYFAEKISTISDEAEEVAERLSVYAIKREI